MKNTLKLLKAKKTFKKSTTDKNEIDINDIHIYGEEENKLLLPQVNDYIHAAKQYEQIMLFYEAGIRQITAKLQILNMEFQCGYDRNPIESINSRIKSQESIILKMKKRGFPLTIRYMTEHIYDIAGIRVVCPFISDVYHVSRMLLNQEDIELIEVKDYIKNPKENGYRSLHLIVMVDVYFSDRKRKVPVEIQLRTIAMNFWASTEHQLRYKKEREFTEKMHMQLLECARVIAHTDKQMQQLEDIVRGGG